MQQDPTAPEGLYLIGLFHIEVMLKMHVATFFFGSFTLKLFKVEIKYVGDAMHGLIIVPYSILVQDLGIGIYGLYRYGNGQDLAVSVGNESARRLKIVASYHAGITLGEQSFRMQNLYPQ